MSKEFLQQLRNTRKTYSELIEFCCNHPLLNNYIYDALTNSGYDFETYCGNIIEYYDKDGNEVTEEEYENIDDGTISHKEIMQYYLISSTDAERLAEYTNELVIYNEEIDVYILCVTHWGTSWTGVNSNWKVA